MEDRALNTAWKSRVGMGAAVCLETQGVRGASSCRFEGTVCSVAHLSSGMLVYTTGMDGAIPSKPNLSLPFGTGRWSHEGGAGPGLLVPGRDLSLAGVISGAGQAGISTGMESKASVGRLPRGVPNHWTSEAPAGSEQEVANLLFDSELNLTPYSHGVTGTPLKVGKERSWSFAFALPLGLQVSVAQDLTALHDGSPKEVTGAKSQTWAEAACGKALGAGVGVSPALCLAS